MFSYQLQRNRRSHSIRIKVDHQGQVVVVAPYDCPTRFIESFVSQHQDWVSSTVAKVLQNKKVVKTDPNELTIFGKSYQKKVKLSRELPMGLHISGKEVLINPVSDTATSIERSVTNFLKSTAEKYIVPRTHQLAKTMSISFREITLRNQKTRWGSCSSRGNLNFNWRLVHCPPEVIDYVIIHELAHRTQMNHSARFWEVVGTFDPEFQKHRGWLKRNGMDLG